VGRAGPAARAGTGWHAAGVRATRPTSLLALLLLAAGLLGCGPGEDPDAGPTSAPVLVGAWPEPEARLLAEIAAGLVTAADGGAQVVVLADADAARRALELGDVAVLPAYTGEAWLEVLGRADPPSDPATSLARVREFDERDGLRWLSPPIGDVEDLTSPPADATFAFVVSPAAVPAGEDPPGTLSQLAGLLGRLERPTLCVEPGFAQRADGLAAVLQAYSVARDQVQVLGVPPADAVAGVLAGECDAGLTTATDGQVWRAGLQPLVDDLGVFPAFVPTLVVDEDALAARPSLAVELRPLVAALTTASLGGWNGRVAAGEPVTTVAEDVVEQLLGPSDPDVAQQ